MAGTDAEQGTGVQRRVKLEHVAAGSVRAAASPCRSVLKRPLLRPQVEQRALTITDAARNRTYEAKSRVAQGRVSQHCGRRCIGGGGVKVGCRRRG